MNPTITRPAAEDVRPRPVDVLIIIAIIAGGLLVPPTLAALPTVAAIAVAVVLGAVLLGVYVALGLRD